MQASGRALLILVVSGSVGLLIAQRLKILRIPCTVYERESHLNARSRNWNYGIYWAQAPLAECLPQNLQDSLWKAQVDPNRPPSDKDSLQILNAETGAVLARPPTPNVYRLNRNRFREMAIEGIEVKVISLSNDVDSYLIEESHIFDTS